MASTSDLPGFPHESRPYHLHRGLARRKNHAPPKNYDEEAAPIPDQQEEGPAPVTVRHVFEGLFHTSHHEHARLATKLAVSFSLLFAVHTLTYNIPLSILQSLTAGGH